jgi:hypothetical protein
VKNERRPGLFGPLLLISAGLLFLLNNLGVVDWSIWRSLLSLWPILLIGAGLDLLIGRRSTIASLVVAVLVLALLFGGGWYLVQQSAPSGAAASHTISQTLAGIEQAEITIRAGVSDFRLGPAAGDGKLIEGTVGLRPNQSLDESFTTAGDQATYRLLIAGPNLTLAPNLSRNNAEQWHLDLSQEATLDLDLSVGVGEANVDLNRLELSRLAFHIGVGDAVILLPEQGRFQAKVDGGMGKLVVRIPPQMAVRIQADSGIGDMDVDSEFQRQGDVYLTPGFETAENRVELDVDIGIGSIVIESYRGS